MTRNKLASKQRCKTRRKPSIDRLVERLSKEIIIKKDSDNNGKGN